MTGWTEYLFNNIYLTIFNNIQQYSTIFNNIQQYSAQRRGEQNSFCFWACCMLLVQRLFTRDEFEMLKHRRLPSCWIFWSWSNWVRQTATTTSKQVRMLVTGNRYCLKYKTNKETNGRGKSILKNETIWLSNVFRCWGEHSQTSIKLSCASNCAQKWRRSLINVSYECLR